MIKIAITGFGRIGRSFLRSILCDENAQDKLAVMAINIGPSRDAKHAISMLADSFKYDTIMGTYPGDVSVKDTTLYIDDSAIDIYATGNFDELPWSTYNLDWVVDCSGKATDREVAQKHLDHGVERVLISAPAKEPDISVIPGVNDENCSDMDRIISLGSCTTNALMPMLYVLHDTFGIKSGHMTTIHAYTNSQALIDRGGGDLRRSRAAALNIIPTTTGATKMLSEILPELEDCITGMAIRVPVATVSLIDLTVVIDDRVSAEDIHEAFAGAAEHDMQGILHVSDKELVSSDFTGCDYSVVIDKPLTRVIDSTVKVCGWYDNEWGYSSRLKDFLIQQG